MPDRLAALKREPIQRAVQDGEQFGYQPDPRIVDRLQRGDDTLGEVVGVVVGVGKIVGRRARPAGPEQIALHLGGDLVQVRVRRGDSLVQLFVVLVPVSLVKRPRLMVIRSRSYPVV